MISFFFVYNEDPVDIPNLAERIRNDYESRRSVMKNGPPFTRSSSI